MNKFYESMFNQKIHSPYEAKLINFTYPILSGARFGPTEEDIDNAIEEGYYYGAGYLTDKIGKIYNENKDRPEPFTAEELVNKVFNMNNLKEKGPTVESVPPTAKTSRESSPIKKPETLFKPEIKKELDEKLSKLRKTRESADKKAVKEGKKYIERKTTKEKAKEKAKESMDEELAREQRELEELIGITASPIYMGKSEGLELETDESGYIPLIKVNNNAINALKAIMPLGKVKGADILKLNNYNDDDIKYAESELIKSLGSYYIEKPINSQKRMQLMYIQDEIPFLTPGRKFIQKPKESPRKGKKGKH